MLPLVTCYLAGAPSAGFSAALAGFADFFTGFFFGVSLGVSAPGLASSPTCFLTCFTLSEVLAAGAVDLGASTANAGAAKSRPRPRVVRVLRMVVSFVAA